MNQRITHTRDSLRAKKAAGKIITAMDMHFAILEEAKIRHNFKAAEEVFCDLLDHLNLNPGEQRDETRVQPIGSNLMAFRKAIATIVRYAPDVQTSRKYACFFLRHFKEPYRDETTQNRVLINVIYAYANAKDGNYLKEALDLVKEGLARGLGRPQPRMLQRKYGDDNLNDVFQSVCRSVLAYHKLEIAEDGVSLKPWP
ncbi:hypothetical protein EC973_000082 [Apophysomyces ossiformis]|uniref:Uncharacterized protein n=1 Tax=Apophysomyces ossiformis TaxID=679940 RepID=A0A8H7BYC7_9FUNG|nr:hypothetical protein EC973_000082 [Apophysomyces ossiformis]